MENLHIKSLRLHLLDLDINKSLHIGTLYIAIAGLNSVSEQWVAAAIFVFCSAQQYVNAYLTWKLKRSHKEELLQDFELERMRKLNVSKLFTR